MGILGRPRRRKDCSADNAQMPTRDTPGTALLRRQLMGSDPVLARVAEEAMCAEIGKAAPTKIGPADARKSADLIACAQPPGRDKEVPGTAPGSYFGRPTRSLRTCFGGLDRRENGAGAPQQRRGARGPR
jgi:hypothetical protein